jgi:hypothetical protein
LNSSPVKDWANRRDSTIWNTSPSLQCFWPLASTSRKASSVMFEDSVPRVWNW